MLKIKLTVILITACSIINLYAQENTISTGGDAIGSGGTASYSVGQVFYFQNDGINNSSLQGVQQPYEISLISSISTENVLNLELYAYPNPTSDNLSLELVNGEGAISLIIYIYDMQGKLLLSEKVKNNLTNIDMKDFTSGTYFLKVINNLHEYKTFKIIKN